MSSLPHQRTGQPSIHSNNNNNNNSNTLSSTRPHQSLARRLLFPNHSGDLPPLLQSNVPPELQAELYDFIALALRAYINPWWTKVTRYDKEFLPQTARIITVVVRALETRALALDLASLVFQDVPMIVTQHYRDYRNAASKVSSSYATGGAASLPQLFHQLQPHIALSSDGTIDLEYYRQIVDHILKSCLPPEDYAPEAERLIVREVIVKVLVNDVVPKVTQPWFIQKTILDLLGSNEEERLFKPLEQASQQTGTSLSFHTLIVVVLSALQSFSSTCLALIHAYKQAITTIKLVNQSPIHTPQSTTPLLYPPGESAPHETEPYARLPRSRAQPISNSLSISPTPSITSSVSYPSRSLFPQGPPEIPPSPHDQMDPYHPSNASSPSKKLPHVQCIHYASSPLALFSEVFLIRERLAASTFMQLLEMISASMTSFLDRLLPHLLYTTLSPGFILNVLRLGKKVMFPNGYPGPPPVEPTLEEQIEIKERLIQWKGKGGLSHLNPLLLGTDQSYTLNAAIDPLTSQPCNVHLLVVLLDRILVGLFPELTGSGNNPQCVTDAHVVANNSDAGQGGGFADGSNSGGGGSQFTRSVS